MPIFPYGTYVNQTSFGTDFFAEEVKVHHPVMRFTAEISDIETIFLDPVVYHEALHSTKNEKKLSLT